MWSVGGAERCGESEEFSLFASYRAVGPHTQASKTGKIWQDAVSWDEEGLQSSDQRINHVGMDQERSNTERMRGFGTILL